MEDHLEAPTTIKEVGIHIGYMRNDLGKLTKLVEDLPKSFATKEELADQAKDNANTYVTKETYNKLASKINPIIVFCSIAAGTIITAVVGTAVTFLLNGGIGAK